MAGDSRCPECGEPIGARSRYCMHCGVELATDAGEPDRQDRDGEATTPRSFDPDFGVDADTTDDDHWLDPDSLFDDSLTVVVGVALGGVAGVLALLVGLFVTGAWWGFLLGPVVLFGGTGVFVTRHSVYETVRLGCYTNGVLIVCLPTIVLTDAAEGGTFAGQVLLFAIVEIPFGIVAALVAGFGYWIGKRGPATDESTA